MCAVKTAGGIRLLPADLEMGNFLGLLRKGQGTREGPKQHGGGRGVRVGVMDVGETHLAVAGFRFLTSRTAG